MKYIDDAEDIIGALFKKFKWWQVLIVVACLLYYFATK